MPGKLLCFTQKGKHNRLHIAIGKLFISKFGKFIVPNEFASNNGIPGPGKNFIELLSFLDNTLKQFIFSDSATLAMQSEIVPSFAKMKLVPSQDPVSAVPFKTQFYNDLLSRMNYCMILGNYFANSMMHYQADFIKIDKRAFHLCCGYWLLLQSIITLNMAVHYSNGVSSVKAKEKEQKINTILKSIQNWMQALELDHLSLIEDTDFHALRKLFFQHLHQFKIEISHLPEFVDILPDELYFPLSPEKLELHLKKKNERAQHLGVPYCAQIIRNPHSTLCYEPDGEAINLLFLAIKKMYASPNAERMQFLFYYNHEFGIVDLLDVNVNKKENIIEIINIHSGCATAQYFFLKKLIEKLKLISCEHRVLACQANILAEQVAMATYPYALSAMVAKVDFIDLCKSICVQPFFMDVGHPEGRYLDPIKVIWFPFAALGSKSILFTPNLKHMQEKLVERYGKAPAEDKFRQYERMYNLYEDPKQKEPSSYYIDYRRRRLGHEMEGSDPLASITLVRLKHLDEKQLETLNSMLPEEAKEPRISFKDVVMTTEERYLFAVEKIKQELGATENGQAMRRAAAGFCTMHKFRFLVDAFRKIPNCDDHPLRIADGNKAFTPLHLALKNDLDKRAVYLIQAGLTEHDFAKENKEKMSARTYIDKALPTSQIYRNSLLTKLLKK